MTSLSIIIPFYNPPVNWSSEFAGKCKEVIDVLGFQFDIKIILVNDGSPSEPINEIKAALSSIPQLQYLKYEDNRGKGHAIRHGVKNSDTDYYIYTDIDFPYKMESLERMANKLSQKNPSFDAVIGTRDKSYYNNIPSKRKYISKVLKAFNSKILRLKIADTQCGLKGFSKTAKKHFLETRIERFLFDVEFIKLLSRDTKMNITESPAILREDITLSKVGVLSLYSELKDYLKVIFR